MNPAHAGALPVFSLLPSTWFRAVNPLFATTAPQPSRRITRFNPGSTVSPSFGLIYFAPDPTTALFEVEALLGSVFSVAVGNPYRSAAVLAYNNVPAYRVADLGNAANRRIVETTLQEMTGEWRTYRSPYRHPAPTQAARTGPPCHQPRAYDRDLFRFSHPLARQTIYDSLPESRRARFHVTVSERLAKQRCATFVTRHVSLRLGDVGSGQRGGSLTRRRNEACCCGRYRIGPLSPLWACVGPIGSSSSGGLVGNLGNPGDCRPMAGKPILP